MITYNNIVSKFEAFATANEFIQTFTHGSPADVDLDKLETYPLMHLVYTGGSYDSNIKTYNLEVYILDNPPRKDDKTGFQKSVISQCEMVAEDILADIENGGNIFTFGFYYELQNASITPLEDERSNILAGSLLSLSIGVAYQYDACNAPLTGVEPEGGPTPSFRARGLLRVRELDGTPDVLSVATMNVPNGSLTDNGDGDITLTFDSLPAGIEGQTLVYSSGNWISGFPIQTGQISQYSAVSTKTNTGLTVGSHFIPFGTILANDYEATPALRAGFSVGFNFTGSQFQSTPPSVGSTFTLTYTAEIRGTSGGLAQLISTTKSGIYSSWNPPAVVLTGDGSYDTYTLTQSNVIVSAWQLSNLVSATIQVLTGTWDVRNPTIAIQVLHA